ncbi:MAG: HAMP domain-containing sensor histidine kinase [Minwuia sp.]|nr:HAMP domain-containing sensor histidine kinase [Minwuia sp.]
MQRPGNSDIAAHNFWTGEFRDRAWEERFRQASITAQRRQTILLGAIIMIASWPIIIFDYLAATSHPDIIWVTATRSLIAISPVVWFMLVRLKASCRTMDHCLFWYAIYVVADLVLLTHLFHADITVIAARAPLYVMIANVMLPMAARLRVVLNLVGITCITGGFWLLANAPVETLGTVSSILMTAHLFGFAAGSWLARLRRAEFARASELEEANTALRLSHQQMEEANAAKSIFLSNVSHELRTPLNAIIGFSEMLDHKVFGPLGDRRYEGYAHDISKSGRLLLDLINDLLDLNKVEAGKFDLDPEWVNIRESAKDWMTMIRMAERLKGADRIVVAELPDVDALVDIRALQQIILNLLTNALKYAGDNARITLIAEVDGQGRLHFGVADTGVGMPATTVARLLRPFEQEDARISRRAEGWGLGLPLANGLATAIGGELSIESTPGKGTRAVIVLPAALLRQHGKADAA